MNAQEDPSIGVVQDEDIFYLVLNDGNNMFNDKSIKKWHSCLDKIEAASKGPAVLITISTSDRVFSTGFDLQYWGSVPYAPFKSLPKFQQILARLMTFPMPTMCICTGHTLAAGIQIALAHDFRIMADGRGKMGLVELKMGIPLMAPFTSLINATLPVQTVRKLMYGLSFTPKEALRDQICSDLYTSAEDLQEKIRAFSETFGPIGQYRKSIKDNKIYLFKDTLSTMERECFGPHSLPQVFKALDMLTVANAPKDAKL